MTKKTLTRFKRITLINGITCPIDYGIFEKSITNKHIITIPLVWKRNEKELNIKFGA